MAKEKSTEKKHSKKEKLATDAGVAKKDKKDKKDKKEKKEKLAAAIAASTDEDSPAAVSSKVDADEDVEMDGAAEDVKRPIGALVPFANPLADDKVTKKVLKGVKKAASQKLLRRGVKEVVKSLRKSPLDGSSTAPAAVVVLAADISPMDVISHIPVLCEDHNIPYVYVQSRAELGAAGATKRPTSVVMVVEKGKKKGGEEVGDEEFEKTYKELVKVVQKEASKVKV